ncbi:uncharacterized protein [Blastocystis hominis]|uniref:Protein phosphatase n=1 Tax=Blastocystis hominis TaxID=12968 RepID=D8M0D5_BLAHO|nr:uncharacterized protein [Blastocystis hominis]CBK21524.2 unnamed protein product [Blastocystis hominis]|eukprot:XP_012895572.1 uncharacterized protein [Blastocystis hominis]
MNPWFNHHLVVSVRIVCFNHFSMLRTFLQRDMLWFHGSKASFTRLLSTAVNGVNPLKIISAAKSIPHPEKKQGEDAFFFNEFAAGVADGVGGWRQHGVDPGEFSRSLVTNMNTSISKPVTDASDLKWKAISVAQSTCSSVLLGSSTLCALALGVDNKAFYYNIGDSGFFLFRFGAPQPTAQRKEWFVHSVSPKQCHAFNFPFQLGKGADSPMMGVSGPLDVQRGDLCLISSDGLLDNVWPKDLVALLNDYWKNGMPAEGVNQDSLQEVVNKIVDFTFKKSGSRASTPFEQEALQNGYRYEGGKPDDITAVLTLFSSTGLEE